MNSDIRDEMILLLNIYEVEANEQIKILAICTKFLDSKKYVDEMKNVLDNVFNGENFNINTEFSRILLAMINLNRKVTFIKEVKEKRIKYLIYCVLFSYLIKNQSQIINTLSLGELRLLFCNAIDLILLVPETIKIGKEGLCSCLFGGGRIKI